MGKFLLGLVAGFLATALIVYPTGFFDDAQWATVLIAVAALSLAAYQAYLSRDHCRKLSMPHCVMYGERTAPAAFEIKIRNAGPGVAHMRTLTARVGEQVVALNRPSDLRNVFTQLGAANLFIGAAGVRGDGFYLNSSTEFPILKFAPHADANELLSGLTLSVEISSLYGDIVRVPPLTLGPVAGET